MFTRAPDPNGEAAMISIAQKLRAARERSGLTQEALAAAAGGVSQAQISLYERGLLRPEDEVAERILRAARPRPRAVLGRNAERIATIGRRHSVTRVLVAEPEPGAEPILIVSLAPTAAPHDLSGFAVEVEDLLDASIVVLSDEPRSDEVERVLPLATALVPSTESLNTAPAVE
jgi:transcriptional regulator with XRE-family HTH domain